MNSSPLRSSSLDRIAAIASNTFIELTRLKSFYVLLLFALLLIGNSIFMSQFTFQQEFQVLKDISLGSMSVLSSLLAILATAQLIPRDLEDRTIYTLLAKPVSRFEYLFGKLTGVLLLLALGLIGMSLLFFLVLKVREQSVLSDTVRRMATASPEQISEALDAVRAAALNTNLVAGVAIIYLKSCLLAALTLFVSTFASTTIFTTTVMVFVYFIGHLQSTARTYWFQTHAASWIAKSLFVVITLFFPDLQLFNLVDDIAAGTVVSPALLAKTGGLGCLYIAFYSLMAWSVFAHKEL